jgi:hypothetical protein
LLSSPLYSGKETAVGSVPRPRLSLFGSSDERIPLGLGWHQFHLAKAALGFGCS